MRHRPLRLRVRVAVGLVLSLCVAGAMLAQETRPVSPGANPEDGPAYPVSRFALRYIRDNPRHPPLGRILQTEVDLGWTWQGYVAPREGISTVTIALGDAVNRGTEVYYASALQKIIEAVRDRLVKEGLMGVYVSPDPMQIDETGKDLRPAGESSLTLLLTTGNVTELRTLASGERVDEDGEITPDNRINHPVHRRILDRSPIQPYLGAGEQRDLLHKGVMDRYLFHLSRHPGRRVDASVAAAREPGGVALDYLVTENRPLVFYAQISNTGTRSTDYLRQRFGFMHTQLTDNDDILSFDYVTSWFDKTNAVFGSYEAPFENDRIRWRVHGNWQDFTADQVGFFDDEFEGESWAFGGELIANVYQQRELFIDLLGGVRYENVEVDNKAFAIRGEEDFIIPHVGARLDRTTEWFSTQATAMFEFGFGDADEVELSALGRTLPDDDWTVFKWGVSHAFYLEPIFDRRGWQDPTTPEDSTLAHELMMSVRGQYAFDNRLIPQQEQVVGGLYTVRGYPESAVAGDSVVIATLEYRYHVPRAFEIEPEPRELFGEPFRAAPQYVYGRPDWDLILKAFIDAGRTWNSDRLSFESDEDLLGAGVGLEFIYKRNLNLRLDWGFVLEELEGANVNEGSNRLHFVATILF